MNLIYQVILYLFVKTTLCHTDNVFSINVTKHFTLMYGDCLDIPYEYTFPLKNVTLPYKELWFDGNKVLQKITYLRSPKNNALRLSQLPPGEHVLGLRLEWGQNETYTYPETVRVSVSASTKSPEVTMNNLVEGRPGTLHCTAPMLCNRESATITWRGANVTLMPQNSNRMRFSPTSSTVQITPKAAHHNTNVTCQLRYRYNTLTEKNITLKVQYPPNILSSSKCVRNENKIVCKCVSHGNPLPTINWMTPCGSYLTKCASNDSQTVTKEIMVLLESYNHNSTITCISNNYLGNDTKNFNVQNLTSIFNPTNELNSNALTVPWTITGVSLCLGLVMLIIVIFQYKQAQRKKYNEEMNMYASVRRTSVEQEYSVILQ